MRVHRARFVLLGASLAVTGVTGCSSDNSTASRDAGMDSTSHAQDGSSGAGREGGSRDGQSRDGASHDAVVMADDVAVGDAGPSYLTDLRVTAAPGATPVTLTPAFAPSIHDYFVACAAGNNALSVSMSAASGGLTQLEQPTASAKAAQQTLSVSVPEGSAIVATVTLAGVTTEYWVRCLPHDFPPPVWLPHAGAAQVTAGYYLVGGWWPPAGMPGYAAVIDSNGVPVWFSKGPAFGVSDVVALTPNTITFFPFNIGTIYPYETLDLNAKTATPIAPSSSPSSQHEMILLANGDYLVIATPLTTGVDLTGLDLLNSDGSETPLGPNSNIQDCAIVEFQSDGTVVHTWLASDHFDANEASTMPLIGTAAETGQDVTGDVYDVFHCNSIDIDPANGNLLISARHMDSVFYIDWTGTQKILWKMGGKNSTKDNATYVTVADPFDAQHDARLQPGWSPTCRGGAGQISVFDDESFTQDVARATVYDVVVGDGDGGASGEGGADAACSTSGTAGTATLAWQYKGIQDTGLGGSFRIGADGTRLIGWGSYGESGWVFSEVDVNQNDLLDLHFGDGDTSYRSIKVPLSTFDIETLRTTAGFQ